jgi:hypothetical protein
MTLETILTLPGASVKEKSLRIRDWLARKSVKLIPSRIRFWVTVSEISHATAENPKAMRTPVDEVLRDLRTPKVVR